jgi:hypothetical protein
MSADRRPGGVRSPALTPLTLVVVLLSACDAFPAVVPVGPLVTIESRGGLCVNGPCGGTIAIERDGRVHALAPKPMEMRRLPEAFRLRLEQAIRAADFGRLQSRPFTGECPVNFDGEELIYTFGTVVGPVRLASCEVDIDPSDPLFAAVQAALSIR